MPCHVRDSSVRLGGREGGERGRGREGGIGFSSEPERGVCEVACLGFSRSDDRYVF